MTNSNTDEPTFDDEGEDGLHHILNQSRDANPVIEQWRELIALARKLAAQEQRALAIVLAAAAGAWATAYVLE